MIKNVRINYAFRVASIYFDTSCVYIKWHSLENILLKNIYANLCIQVMIKYVFNQRIFIGAYMFFTSVYLISFYVKKYFYILCVNIFVFCVVQSIFVRFHSIKKICIFSEN